MRCIVIPELDERYSLSEDGTVTTLATGLVRKPVRNKQTGYLGVNFWNGKKYVTKHLHRMLAEAFIPNPDALPVVNHKDGNKLNNGLANLEWTTVKANNRHYHQGLMPYDDVDYIILVAERGVGYGPGGVRGWNFVCACPFCGEVYLLRGCYFNIGRGKFCSRRCGLAYRSKG